MTSVRQSPLRGSFTQFLSVYAITRGFTLIDLMLTLTLLAILGGFALFTTTDWLQSIKADSIQHDIRTNVNIARHTALVRNANVIMCPRGQTGCGPRNTWHNGTMIFTDPDRNHAFSAGDTVVLQTPPIRGGYIRWRAFRSRNYLMFTPRGITDWQNGHMIYCSFDGRAEFTRQVVLNVTGRTYPSRDRNRDGIHEDVQGRALRCPV